MLKNYWALIDLSAYTHSFRPYQHTIIIRVFFFWVEMITRNTFCEKYLLWHLSFLFLFTFLWIDYLKKSGLVSLPLSHRQTSIYSHRRVMRTHSDHIIWCVFFLWKNSTLAVSISQAHFSYDKKSTNVIPKQKQLSEISAKFRCSYSFASGLFLCVSGLVLFRLACHAFIALFLFFLQRDCSRNKWKERIKKEKRSK